MSAMHKAMNLCVQTLQDAYMFSDNDNTKQTYTTQYLHCEQLHGGPAKTTSLPKLRGGHLQYFNASNWLLRCIVHGVRFFCNDAVIY